MGSFAPLIVTLQLDETSQLFFDALRKKYFPPERNLLNAHLTLFHHLPAIENSITDDLKTWSIKQQPLLLHVAEVKNIGKGVAYKINSAALPQLHKQMQEKWHDWLTPQDKQKLWPHVTVQNKVSHKEAAKTQRLLQESFQPFMATGTGFGLWEYKGGPWKALQTFLFKAD